MQKEYVKMLSEALDKTVIMDNWQVFSKKLFQHFIHHKKIYYKSQNFNLKSYTPPTLNPPVHPPATIS